MKLVCIICGLECDKTINTQKYCVDCSPHSSPGKPRLVAPRKVGKEIASDIRIMGWHKKRLSKYGKYLIAEQEKIDRHNAMCSDDERHDDIYMNLRYVSQDEIIDSVCERKGLTKKEYKKKLNNLDKKRNTSFYDGFARRDLRTGAVLNSSAIHRAGYYRVHKTIAFGYFLSGHIPLHWACRHVKDFKDYVTEKRNNNIHLARWTEKERLKKYTARRIENEKEKWSEKNYKYTVANDARDFFRALAMVGAVSIKREE